VSSRSGRRRKDKGAKQNSEARSQNRRGKRLKVKGKRQNTGAEKVQG
jgi:hypothetical protein